MSHCQHQLNPIWESAVHEGTNGTVYLQVNDFLPEAWELECVGAANLISAPVRKLEYEVLDLVRVFEA